MKKHFQELQELFPLDHLLLFIVGYVCPKSDFSDFCDHIHIPYAIALVGKRLEKIHSLSVPGPTEVKELIICLNNILLCVQIGDILCKPLSVLQHRINKVESFE